MAETVLLYCTLFKTIGPGRNHSGSETLESSVCCKYVSFVFLAAIIVLIFASGSGLDPDSNGSADPDRGRPKVFPKKLEISRLGVLCWTGSFF